ncbi:hypothetical protein [Methylobacterium sp. 17Sr1-1]|uniref:hypothetical protein n=1 Tax=Methylobacterium sp. 17Sr1-1 TaxID=2202826 RepID=UPI001950566E|nr:hypothetical protein [Methylobacterium sp. 17Sr1-1]
MDGTWSLLFAPPPVAVFAARLGSRAIERGAAQIDRGRQVLRLQVLRRQVLRRQVLRKARPMNQDWGTVREPMRG